MEKKVEEKLEKKVEEPKKPGFFGRLKEAAQDNEEQLAILSTFVRLGILVWSGGILTLAYVKLPPRLGIPEQKLDPTFIASVFTGVLATFGVQAGQKKANGNGGSGVTGTPQYSITKQDMERLIEKAGQVAPTQTIRIEQAPIKITTDSKNE